MEFHCGQCIQFRGLFSARFSLGYEPHPHVTGSPPLDLTPRLRTCGLRGLPAMHSLLAHDGAAPLAARFGRDALVDALRAELAAVRDAVRAGRGTVADAQGAGFFGRVEARLHVQRRLRLERVVNATGVVLHTNLGRAPLATQAIAALQEVAAGYSNLEFDLDRGERGSRHAHVEEILCRLTGAEAALVVNNCAAAVLLALTALARGGEVIVSRGELIEIGGAFRLPEVIAQSGATLVEVGTTNKTRVDDYARAITPSTRLILRCHPSNFRMLGFTEQPVRSHLAVLAREHGLPLVEDLGSGTLVDLRRFGLPTEPTVQACVREGGGLVTFSGDKLLGGPQAGVLVGPAPLVRQLREHPLQRALRIDKLSLAALAATLALYDGPVPAEQHVPALRMLAQPAAKVARRAQALQRRLRRVVPALSCTLCKGESLAGGGSLPGAGLPTSLLQVAMPGVAAEVLARRMRQATPPVIGRIVDDCFTLDLRTVAAHELGEVAAAFAQSLAPREER